MTQIAVGGAVNEGFSLIRRHPGSVVLWGLSQIVLTIATFSVYGPVYYSMFAAMRAGGAAAMQTLQPQMAQMQSFGYLIDIVQVLVASVVWCAVFRAVLHPEQSRFGFLRVGVSEFFVGVLLIGGYMAFAFALILAVLVAVIVIALLAVMHLVWAAVIVGIAAAIAFFAALIYFGLRFSMVGPMIVDDGKFHLGESWALTRGHVGSLFMIGLLTFVVAMIAEIVLLIVLVAVGAGALTAIAGGLHNIPVLFQEPPQVLFARLGPILVIAGLIWIPFIGCLLAVMAAPWARAYRDLQPPDMAATFA